jgi:cytochrome b involved in lipid metabolism
MGSKNSVTLTLREVKEKGYIIAHGKVYDPHPFMVHHKGGEDLISRYLGQDCSYHYDMHNRAAKKVWKRHYVGRLRKN